LDGDQSPKTTELQFSNLPGGEYKVTAVVIDALGHQRAIAHQSATVISVLGGR
jgi:hypothetical protein